MQLIRGLHNLRPLTDGCVATIGNFDGVHLGHRAVIDTAGGIARGEGRPHAVLTFEPHPRSYFAPDAPPFRLMNAEARAARLELDRLEDWRVRAVATTADLSGKTPQALISALIATPVLSAQAAEAHTGSSRAAVQRNLSLFTKRGLVREITGQERYRFWGVLV